MPLSLVGKVNYFWEGKSLVLGGTAAGGQVDPSMGGLGARPWNLLGPMGWTVPVSWSCRSTASGGTPCHWSAFWRAGAYAQHTYRTEVPWSEAQPGFSFIRRTSTLE